MAFCFVFSNFAYSILTKIMKKLSKKKFIIAFGGSVLVLALVRCVFPDVARSGRGQLYRDSTRADSVAYVLSDSIDTLSDNLLNAEASDSIKRSRFFARDGSPARHPILSVPNFGRTFPDQNDIQLVAANRWGVQPVDNREEANEKHSGLVYVGSNPYFYIDKLHSSIPYLVPRAAELLQAIGRTYYDSLIIKGIPLNKLIITSVLRSKEDVAQLRSHNGNATQNSCHMYGTTFDVSYNRYQTVEAPGERRRRVRNDTLKWVLSEVLRDMRVNNRCYIKYEIHQGCFHITVR